MTTYQISGNTADMHCGVPESRGSLRGTHDYLTTAQAAEILGLSVHTLISWRRPGNVGAPRLPHYKRGRQVRYLRGDVESFRDSLMDGWRRAA